MPVSEYTCVTSTAYVQARPHARNNTNNRAPRVGSEDSEAGFTGLPFTQMEHEEEWVGCINWSEVEAQAGGSKHQAERAADRGV